MSEGSIAIVGHIAGARPMTPSASSVGDLRGGQAQLGQQLVVVLPQQRRGLGVERSGPPENLIGTVLSRSPAVHRVLDFFEEAAKRQLLQLGLAMRLHDLGHRNAGIPEGCDDVVAAAVLAPRGQLLVDADPVARADPSAVASLGSIAQEGDPSAPHRLLPLLVGCHGDGDPAVEPAELVDVGAAVEVLGRRRRSPVARAFQQRPVGGVLDDLFGGDAERGIDHRGFDEHALAGAAAVFQRQQQRVERVHTRALGSPIEYGS